MKATELVKQLNKLIEVYGDQDVVKDTQINIDCDLIETDVVSPIPVQNGKFKIVSKEDFI